jgi:hypothetical protein
MASRERARPALDLLPGAVLLLLTLEIVPAGWAATYRWIDERGRVHYSDTLPPPGAAQSVLDKQGRVLQDKSPRPAATSPPGERTGSPAQARERQDRALLSTYVHEDEIDLARDRALAQERARQTSIDAMLRQAHDRLTRLKAEAGGQERAGRAVSANVKQSLDETEREIARLEAMRERTLAAMAQIEARYAGYKQRFRELKGQGSAPSPSRGVAGQVGNTP